MCVVDPGALHFDNVCMSCVFQFVTGLCMLVSCLCPTCNTTRFVGL